MRRMLHSAVLWLCSFVARPARDVPEAAPMPLRPLVLRPPYSVDVPGILDVERSDSGLDPAFADAQGFWRYLGPTGRHCYVAILPGASGDRVVGYVVFDKKPDSLELARIVVHREHRRNGFGLRLLKVVFGRLNQHQRSRVTATIPDDRKDLHLFLAASDLGFTGYTPSQAHDVVPDDHYLFVARLVPYVDYTPACSRRPESWQPRPT